MKKLLSMIVAATFAAVSVSALAASYAGAQEKKEPAKKEAAKKEPAKKEAAKKAPAKKEAAKKAPAKKEAAKKGEAAKKEEMKK